jgi:hypothetical protein
MGRVDLVAAGDADSLEVGRGLEERLVLEPAGHPDPRRGQRHGTPLLVDHEEHHANATRLEARGTGHHGDVVTGRAPELLERLPAPGRGLVRGRVVT